MFKLLNTDDQLCEIEFVTEFAFLVSDIFNIYIYYKNSVLSVSIEQ